MILTVTEPLTPDEERALDILIRYMIRTDPVIKILEAIEADE